MTLSDKGHAPDNKKALIKEILELSNKERAMLLDLWRYSSKSHETS